MYRARPLRADRNLVAMTARTNPLPRRRTRGPDRTSTPDEEAGRRWCAGRRPLAPEASDPRRGRERRSAARANAPNPGDEGPARRQLLGARAGHPDARRPRRARAVSLEQAPGLQRGAGRHPADARGPRLLAGTARRLPEPAPRGHLGGSHRRAHRPRAAEPGRHGRPPREDARRGAARPLQRDLRVPRGAGRVGGRQDRCRAGQPPGRPVGFPKLHARHGARAAHQAGRAPRLRAVHAGDHRRGRQPRHSVPAPRPAQPRAARAG